MKNFFNILKVLMVVLLSVAAIAFSGYVLYKMKNSKDGDISSELAPILTDKIECGDDEYLENEICVPKNKTCPDGSVIPSVDNCKIINYSTSTSENSTSTKVLSITNNTQSTSSKSTTNKPKEILPTINNIKITEDGKSMVVSISGKNFDSGSNIVTLTAGAEISKKMILPAYPMPDKTQQINFKVTDFRNIYNGEYSFQVESKGKLSDVYILYK